MEGVMVISRCSKAAGKKALREKVFSMDSQDTKIVKYAMKNNIRIQAANLENIRQIGEEAFMGCTSLNTVRLENLRKIDKRAFSGCSKLKKLHFPSSLYKIQSGAFQNNKRLQTVIFRKACGMRLLDSEVFSGCAGLRDIRFPGKLEEIGSRTFYKCVALSRIELPLTLKRIGKESFYQCGLNELELPEGLLEIGEGALLKCKSLDYIYIPDTVQKIGKWAFHGCSRLKVLEINHDPAEIGEWITNKNCTIRCPEGSKMEAYARAYGMLVEYY